MDPVKTTVQQTRKWMVKNRPKTFPKNLEGLCAIASHKLFKNLQKKNIQPKIVVADLLGGGSHCWVQVEENVFDITSTQFNLRTVYNLSRSKYIKKIYENASFEIKFVRYFEFEDEETFIKHLYKNSWPISQIPKRI